MKKIGVIVDGAAESQALKLITQKIYIPDAQILNPLYADIQPRSAPGQIARSVKSKLDILIARQVDQVVVLIDREDRSECPTRLAQDIEGAFRKLGHKNVSVIIKNRKFENWLIADVEVFRNKARYKVTNKFIKAVVPNKADSVDNAEALLNQICIGTEYHKRRDAAQITDLQDVSSIGNHSRSFRRFLRLIGHPDYIAQSKNPTSQSRRS